MKKHLLLLILMMLPIVASAYDIIVENDEGVNIYYNYINDGKELEVTYIGNSYVSHSDRYTGNVVIPEEVTYMNRTRKVMSIGENAFRQCSGLTSVTIPNSVTSIGDYAFDLCSGLKSVTIGNSVTSIGLLAFGDCSELTSVTIPNCVTFIGDLAFGGCSGLTSVTIGNSVTSIGNFAFWYCSGLTSVTIPNSVTSIGGGAFQYCSGLMSVTIGNSVTSIDHNAFDGGDILTVISLIENPFQIIGNSQDGRTFTLNTFYNATLYVPKGTIDKYKATEGWKDFLFIEEGSGPGSGSGEGTTTEKCAKPTISYNNGKLTYHCETEGATCQSTISDTDIKSYSGNEVQLAVTYTVEVYAEKSGYQNSDMATATLCWIDVEPKTEGITTGTSQIPAKAVLIQSLGGLLTIQGADDGTKIGVYNIDGTLVGEGISRNGCATVNTNLQPGSVAIIKIGDRSVKVVIK